MTTDFYAGSDQPTMGIHHSVVRASVAPVIVSVVALLVSLAISVIAFIGKNHSLGIHGLGYLLSPFLVVGCLATERAIHLKKCNDPWYDAPRGMVFIKYLQILSALAFLVGAEHAWQLAVLLSRAN